LEVDLLMHMVNRRKLVGVIEGDRDPVEALPELVKWCKKGVLQVGKMLRNYPVREFWEAREAMERGEVIKGVLIW
jgi:Zn-dependent alcohol dehydrogenase